VRGLDGVVAKPLAAPYQQGKRADAQDQALPNSRGGGPGLPGSQVRQRRRLPSAGSVQRNGTLYPVGGISAFTDVRRLELIDELAPLVVTDDKGEAVKGATDRSRFSGNKDVSFVQLRPERVVEVKFDQMEGQRFRHTVTLLRWRPDRDPESCSAAQVDRPIAYDLDAVLQR